MPKVTVHDVNNPPPVETPTQKIVRAANDPVEVVDATGRVIVIKKLTPVERLRMLKLIGGQNEHYMGMAALAYLVASIDGSPVTKPTSELQIEARIQQLGDDGIDAIAKGAAEFAEDGAGVDELKN